MNKIYIYSSHNLQPSYYPDVVSAVVQETHNPNVTKFPPTPCSSISCATPENPDVLDGNQVAG